MKHIVIDMRDLGSSTSRYVERLVHYLQQVDNSHRYTILIDPKAIDKWEPSNPHFTKLACPYKQFTFSEQIGFKRYLDDLKADLVHFPMVQQPLLYRGKTVTTMQDLTGTRFRNPSKNWLIFTIKQTVYKLVNVYVPHKADALIAPTDFVRQDVARYAHVNLNKITVTHEAVEVFDDPEEIIPSFKDKQYIMFNGRPLPHKNLRRLIESFALLYKKYPKLYLMIAGKKDASHQSYTELARRLGVSDRVILTDWITDGQLKWAMRHTKAYVWASLSEGFGLPPLEAMLYEAPVASSNATCMPEVLGDAAHYFDPTSVEDMARCIDEVVSDEKLRQSLIGKGKKQVAKYSWKRMAEQTLTVYHNVLGE